MDLREFLFYERKSITDFARELRVSREYMNGIVSGRVKPSFRLAEDIELATNGKVKASSLLKKKKSGSKS